MVRRHLEWLLSARFGRSPLLVERAVVGLLRIANRNLFRDNTVADDVLQSLSLLLRLSPKAMYVFSRQISYGLHELLRTNAANVHRREHWAVLFAHYLRSSWCRFPFKMNATSARGPRRMRMQDFREWETIITRPQTDDRGYTSDDPKRVQSESHFLLVCLGGNAARVCGFSRGSLVLRTNLGRHEPASFLKVCDTLSFLLRDAIHVTPDNFESCVACLRTMVEASLDGGRYAAGPLSGDAQNRLRSHVDDRMKRPKAAKPGKKDLSTDVTGDDSEIRREEQQLTASYQQVSLQLLDLCSTLHSLAPGILAHWAKSQPEVDASIPHIWCTVWRPLLQAIARLGCDCRRLVRAAALTHLQIFFPMMH
ncbi:hypothetical protein OSTOST_06090 [Ostertagia ostertagi]